MKFLDSNILAYAFYNNDYTARCQAAIMTGGVIDTLNLVEAFFIIEKETGGREMAQKAVRGLLKSDIAIVDVDVNAVFEAVKRATHSKLSIFDLIHYTSAVTSGCKSILSYDKDFDNLDISREEP